MAYEVGPRYTGTVTAATLTESSMKGTPGIELAIEGDQGAVRHTIYLTPKTRERAERDLALFGVKPEELRKPAFWEALETRLVGKELGFGFAEEEFKGETRLKIAYLASPKKETAATLAVKAATLFGAKPSQPSLSDDDSVPF